MPRLDHDKALGAMIGLAVGDAIGAPAGARPGQGTGVTRLAISLAMSIGELGGYEPGHALRGYVSWYRTDPPGMTDDMREVLGTIAAGDDAYRATSSFHLRGGVSSGNGALMRATPLGIAYAGHDEALRDSSLADAALTHFDPLAGKVALLHNQTVAWLLVGGPQLMFDQLKNPEWLDDRIEDVVIPATSGVGSFAESLAASEPGSALASLAVALVAAFQADSFEQGLRWAVGLGGDTAVDGAVTGALLGARLGASAIPAHWVEGLERRAEIEALMPRLVAVAG